MKDANIRHHIVMIAVVTCFVYLMVACSSPISPASAGPSDTHLDLSDAAAVLRNLPEAKITLPKSLQDGSENSSASKAFGDISNLTSMPLPSLKSEGYLQLKANIEQGNAGKVFLNILKTYAIDHAMPIGTEFEMGTFVFNTNGYDFTWAKSGKIKILESGIDELSYYWALRFPADESDPNNYTDPDSARVPMSLLLKVWSNGNFELFVKGDNFGGGAFSYYENFDAATSTGTQAQLDPAHEWYSTFMKDTDGSLQAYCNSRWSEDGGGEGVNNWVAFGDDNQGGYFSANKLDRDENNDGTLEHFENASVDYYDQNGDLIAQGWGGLQPQVWMSKSGRNIKTIAGAPSAVPDSFKLKHDWTTGEYRLSFNNGVDWTDDIDSATDGNNWSAYWSNSNAASEWISGEVVYWSSNWVYNGTESVVTFEKWYEIPATVRLFGQDYYIVNNYPLKNLLPLSPDYAGKFELKRKEGHISIGWMDPDPNSNKWFNGIKIDETKYLDTAANSSYNWWGKSPTDILADANASPSLVVLSDLPSEDDTRWGFDCWTNYDYWLENLAWRDASGNDDNADDVFNFEKGDLCLTMQEMAVYYWSGGKGVRQTTPSVQAPGAIPKYFSSNASNLVKMESIRNRIDEIVTSYEAKTAAGVLSEVEFDSIMAAALPNFPAF